MKVLVTGGAGYIGSHTCKLLAEAGHDPVVYDDFSTGHREFVRWGDFVDGDIRDTRRLAHALSFRRVDAVIHFAALAEVAESVKDPGKYWDVNVGGTLSVLSAMRQAGVRNIVFSSTCATYGEPVQVPIDESHPQLPVNPYGRSKLAMERMIADHGDAYGLGWVALRYFNACGADPDGQVGEDHDPESHAIPRAVLAAMGHGGFSVMGTDYDTPDGSAVRDYVHVVDLAQAHVAALRHLSDGGASGAFNLGTGTGRSVREVVAAVAARAGRPFEVEEKERRPGDPARLVADACKARETLGWTPARSDLGTIVSDAWAWHEKRHGDLRRHGT